MSGMAENTPISVAEISNWFRLNNIIVIEPIIILELTQGNVIDIRDICFSDGPG